MTTAPRTRSNLVLALALGLVASACSDALPGTPGPPQLPASLDDIGIVAPPGGAPDASADAIADVVTADSTGGDVTADSVGDTSSGDIEADTAIADIALDTVPPVDTTMPLDTSMPTDLATCASDGDCRDGNPCNGMESCNQGVCVPGSLVDSTPRCQGPNGSLTCDGSGNVVAMSMCPLGCNNTSGLCIEEVTIAFGENGNDTNANTEDAGLSTSDVAGNYDLGSQAVGQEISWARWIWVRFDLSSIPAGASLVSVELQLFYTANDSVVGDTSVDVAVARDTTPANNWVESAMNYNTYDGTNLWSAGSDGGAGDFEASSASVNFDGSNVDRYLSWPLDGPGLNRAQARFDAGLRLSLIAYRTFGNDPDPVFALSENADGERPRLLVTYRY